MTTATAELHRRALDQLLAPVCDVLTREAAQAIADLRASPETQGKIEDYANRHREGQLAGDELAEYEALVSGVNLISILQAKARAVLKRVAP